MAVSGADQNINVFLRVKPSRTASNYFSVEDFEPNSISVNLPDSFKSDFIDNTKLHHRFTFNGIMTMKCTQDEVFNQVGLPAVKNAFDGFNSTIFVYGQTGSGKTFTLTGGAERYMDRGIIPRTLSTVYQEIRARTDAKIKVSISYFEIYNEQGYDLLGSEDNRALEDLPKIKLLENDRGGFHLKNLSVHEAQSEEEALNLLFMGDTNRAIAETPMNLVFFDLLLLLFVVVVVVHLSIDCF
jgi:kinesin family protein 6/9